MTDFTQEKQKLKALLTVADRENILAHNAVEQLEKQLRSLTAEQTPLKEKVILFKLAVAILQQLVDEVAGNNIKRIELLVNTALSSIFKDQSVEFKIVTSVKRNQVLYNIVLVQDGSEGGINSFGGGVWASVAVVLKAVILILSKRYPLLAFDESLAFVSANYREAVSQFLHNLTKPSPDGLGVPILMVTHDPEYASSADNTYQAYEVEGGVSFRKK